MGCDIHGWIEVNYYGDWIATMNMSMLLDRDYDLFGCLFGVRNYSGLEPIAERRGVPKDISNIVSKEINEWASDGHSHTWITYEELIKIDHDEQGIDPDGRLHEYIDGKLVSTCSYTSALSDKEYRRMEKGESITKGKVTYCYEPVTRGYCLNSFAYKNLLKLMRIIKKSNRQAKIRLVVWFDN